MLQADRDILASDNDNFGGSFHSNVMLAPASSHSTQRSRPTPEEVENLSQGFQRGVLLDGLAEGTDDAAAAHSSQGKAGLPLSKIEAAELSDTTATVAEASEVSEDEEGAVIEVRQLTDADILADAGCVKFDDMWKKAKVRLVTCLINFHNFGPSRRCLQVGNKWHRVCTFLGCTYSSFWAQQSETFSRNHWMAKHCQNKRKSIKRVSI